MSLFVRELFQASAEAAARAFIEEQGWEVEELDEAYSVDASAYPPGTRARVRFEQAQVDGIVATFHRWPIGAPGDE